MRVEDLAIALRPRQGWEAVDLGFRMAAQWARPVWSTFLAVYLPFAAVLLFAFRETPWAASLLLWWLLPAFDRFVLFVLARRVFGVPAGPADALGDARILLGRGLWRLLLLRPFMWSRSYLDAVQVLEGQRGADAARRRAVLGRRFGGHAMGLALTCIGFVAAIALSGLVVVEMLVPAGQVGGLRAETGTDRYWPMQLALSFALGLAVIEPCFVAAGFALYLVRRTALEGWDLELALRRANLVRASRPPVIALLAFLVLALPAAPEVVAATGKSGPSPAAPGNRIEKGLADMLRSPLPAPEPLDTAARAAALDVVAHPDFGGRQSVKRWRLMPWGPPAQRSELPAWAMALGEWMAVGLRALAWVMLALLLVGVGWALHRQFRGPVAAPGAPAPPRVLFGLAIAPDSLPDDLVAAALAALDAGRMREAVSLLYRGALSHLVHRRGLRIAAAATEGDVLRTAEPLLPAEASAHFRRLLGAWLEIAYAHRPRPEAEIRALCLAHAPLFPVSAVEDRT